MNSFNGNKTVIIINPKAGPKRLDFVTSNLRRFRNEFDYTKISDISEFKSFVKDNMQKYDVFIAAGGDGTVNSLAAELSGTDKILGVLPAGSGNGFAREMGFRKNLRWLLNNVRKKEFMRTDVLYINDHICVNASGVGLDSFVAHGFHHLPRRGFWNYVIMAIKSTVLIKPFNIKINTSGKTIEEKVFMVSIANTRQFGNNAYIAPGAVPDDGKFDIAVVKPFPGIMFPLFAIKMLAGKLKNSVYIEYIVTGEPVMISTPEKSFHIDGEPVIIEKDIKITIRKGALKVLKTDRNRWCI